MTITIIAKYYDVGLSLSLTGFGYAPQMVVVEIPIVDVHILGIIPLVSK